MRAYDADLVKKIQEKTYVKKEDGLEMIIKPVPDDNRENVVDPRVVETTKIKMTVKALDKNSKFSLYHSRVRPDKVSYDLTTSEILEEEDLVEINGSHAIDVYTFTPENYKENRPVLLYLHGGGWMTGDVAEFRMAMRFICEQSGCKVIFPEYRLAPENPYTAPVEDCYAILEWIYENAEMLKVDRNKIMVSGDSAGGNLTNSCLYLDKEKHHIRYAYEFYSAMDSNMKKYEAIYSDDLFPVIEEHKIYAKNRVDRIRFSNGPNNLYLRNKISMDEPIVSIINDEDLSWLPEMSIVCGQYDYLKLSNDAFVKKARSFNVNIRYMLYLGCDHGFMEKVGVLPQAEEVLLDLANVLKNL